MKKLVSMMLIVCMLLTMTACSGEEEYPADSVSVIITKAAGGATDTVVRCLTNLAESKDDKLSFVCENVVGANGFTGMSQGANAKSDGYALTIIPAELSVMSQIDFYKAPVTLDDYRFVSIMMTIPMVLVVRADSDYKDVEDFVDKLDAGTKVGNSGTYGMGDLAFRAAAQGWGKECTTVPYADGDSAAITALVADNPELDAVCVCPSSVLDAQVQAGELKVLASFGTDTCYDAPLASELDGEYGLDINFTTWAGIAVPDDTPDEVYDYLVDAFSKASSEQEYSDTLEGYFINASQITGEDAEAYVHEQYDSFGAILDSLNIE